MKQPPHDAPRSRPSLDARRFQAAVAYRVNRGLRKGLEPASLPQYEMLADVRFGLLADICTAKGDVGCTFKSRHQSGHCRCRVGAKSRLVRCSKSRAQFV